MNAIGVTAFGSGLRRPGVRRQRGPDLGQRAVGLPFLEHQRHDQQVAFGVGMNEVRLHRKRLPGDLVLAGRVEVHLLETERHVVDDQRVAGLEADLDRVAVVDDFSAARRVAGLQRLQWLFATHPRY